MIAWLGRMLSGWNPLRIALGMSWMTWVGGFVFYGAVVLPLLHQVVDSPTGGRVTRNVTHALNAIGGLALGLAWLDQARRDWRTPPDRLDRPHATARWRRLTALRVSTLLLAALGMLHAVMDRHLVEFGLTGFYPLHRGYVWLSTLHWFVNLVWLGNGGVDPDDPSCQEAGVESISRV